MDGARALLHDAGLDLHKQHEEQTPRVAWTTHQTLVTPSKVLSQIATECMLTLQWAQQTAAATAVARTWLRAAPAWPQGPQHGPAAGPEAGTASWLLLADVNAHCVDDPAHNTTISFRSLLAAAINVRSLITDDRHVATSKAYGG